MASGQAIGRTGHARGGLETRTTALVVCAYGVLLCAWALLTILTRDPWPSNDGLLVVLTASFASMGLVIIRRQPHNAVGWLMLAVALPVLFDVDAKLYAVLDYRLGDGDLPLGQATLYFLGGWTLLPILTGLPAILLFPDGRAASRRWRQALWTYAALAVLFMVAQYAGQASVPVGPSVAVDIRGAAVIQDNSLVAGAAWLLTPLFIAYWASFTGHQIASWRRSAGDEREQLKWLMSGGAVSIVSCIAIVMGGDGSSPAARVIADSATLGISALPIGIAVGVLKYRLYGIDRLISRTLSYALLTGLLAACFLSLILLTTRALPLSSPVGVAASTLAAAALFDPLRGRVQRLVDRRFNRTRYDAEDAIDAFAARLREAVDLDSTRAEVLRVVNDSVAPVHASLWIRSVDRR